MSNFSCYDMYNLEFSIKDDERRAAKYQHLPNVFPRPEDIFPGSVEFNKFMLNSANKVRLQKIVKGHLKKCLYNSKMTIMYCDGETTNMSIDQVNTCFIFRQIEADTILLSIYTRLWDNGHTEVAVIDSEDTDVYVQAAYVSDQVYL